MTTTKDSTPPSTTEAGLWPWLYPDDGEGQLQGERPPLELYDDDPELTGEPPLSESERWRQEGEG